MSSNQPTTPAEQAGPKPSPWETMAMYNGEQWARETKRLAKFHDLLVRALLGGEVIDNIMVLERIYSEALHEPD